MVTKRTPVRPPPSKGISPAAVAAFVEMQTIEEGCEKWLELNGILRHEMRLPPWEYPTYGERESGGIDADAVARFCALKAAADAAAHR